MGSKTDIKVAVRNYELVKLDSKFLSCHVCSNPLQTPVFRCAEPHFVCSECTLAEGRKCTCSRKLINCAVLGAILQFTTVWCAYYDRGCKKEFPYSDKLAHEKSCPFNPNCFCPLTDCKFKSSISNLLSSHFKSKHSECCINALYGKEFVCIVPKESKFQVVIGEDGRSFLLLTAYRGYRSLGTFVTLVCMGLESFAEDLFYEISAALDSDSEDTKWSMKSSQMMCIRKWTADISTKTRSFFFYPSKDCDERKETQFKICISKKCNSQQSGCNN